MANMINARTKLTDKDLEMVNGGGILDWMIFNRTSRKDMAVGIKGTPGGNGGTGGSGSTNPIKK